MSKRKPISGFIAEVLYIILALIIMEVVYVYAKTKNETGVELSIPAVIVKQTHNLYVDVTEAWAAAEKDTIK